jgi:hypothetical protein
MHNIITNKYLSQVRGEAWPEMPLSTLFVLIACTGVLRHLIFGLSGLIWLKVIVPLRHIGILKVCIEIELNYYYPGRKLLELREYKNTSIDC